MDVETVSIDQIRFADYNPRTLSKHDFESLQRSLDEFGFIEPVVVNQRNNVIVGGHQRVRAARELGYENVPVVYVDLDEQKERALNIALNKISGEFDNDMLAELIDSLDDESTILTGFTDEEISKLQDGWVNDEDDEKPKETRYTLDQLRTYKTAFKASHQDHSADAFVDYLQHEANKER